MALGGYLSTVINFIEVIFVVLLIREVFGIGYDAATKTEAGKATMDKAKKGGQGLKDWWQGTRDAQQKSKQAAEAANDLKSLQEEDLSATRKFQEGTNNLLGYFSGDDNPQDWKETLENSWDDFYNDAKTVIDSVLDDDQSSWKSRHNQLNQRLDQLREDLNQIASGMGAGRQAASQSLDGLREVKDDLERKMSQMRQELDSSIDDLVTSLEDTVSFDGTSFPTDPDERDVAEAVLSKLDEMDEDEKGSEVKRRETMLRSAMMDEEDIMNDAKALLEKAGLEEVAQEVESFDGADDDALQMAVSQLNDMIESEAEIMADERGLKEKVNDIKSAVGSLQERFARNVQPQFDALVDQTKAFKTKLKRAADSLQDDGAISLNTARQIVQAVQNNQSAVQEYSEVNADFAKDLQKAFEDFEEVQSRADSQTERAARTVPPHMR